MLARIATAIRTALQHGLERQWQHGGWLATLLRPLAGLTGLAARIRSRHAQRRRWRAPVPVVVVGNILVGGTGKTPVVIAIVAALQARGWRPGVVSRGYGVALGPAPRVRRGVCAPAEVGDEPALIAAATGAPIAVHPRRPLAVQALLSDWPDTDVIIADDGLQHLALARDVEIAVQDARGIGNGRLLPAGPLREPASRLQSVDVVVTHLGADALASALPAASAASAPAPRHLTMQLAPEAYVRVHDGLRLAPEAFRQTQTRQRIAAAAGIGQPERFFTMLRRHGITLADTLALPDHYAYRQSPFSNLTADLILITAKDAVKCQAWPRTDSDARLWSVEVAARFSDPDWFDWLDARLRWVGQRVSP